MGRAVNKVFLIGTLGRDPELKYMPNGTAVVNLSLATDESYNDKQTGQKVEKTEWHRLTAYGKLAEIIAQYLKKGSRAYFEGKLQTREWLKDNVKRYTTEIITNDMMMLDSRGDNAGAQPGGFNQHSAMNQTPAQQPAQQPMQQGGFQPQPQQPAHQPMNGFAGASADYDDDIPF